MIKGIKYRWNKYYDIFRQHYYKLPEVSVDELTGGRYADAAFNLISTRINLPSKFRPEFTHDDLVPLLRLVKHYDPANLLELGTAHGNTVANIRANHACRIYTVNALPEQISGSNTTFVLTRDDIGIAFRTEGLDENVQQIYENTLNMDLSKYFPEGHIDFAIIDACHDTDFVVNDFFKILPFLKKGAVVLFHDTHPSQDGHLKGSYQACVLLREKGYKIKHIKDTWWGFWTNK